MSTRKPRDAYTSEQVMEILGISRNTFWRYMRQFPDDFRTYKSGRWRVMDPQDLAHWREFCKHRDAA